MGRLSVAESRRAVVSASSRPTRTPRSCASMTTTASWAPRSDHRRGRARHDLLRCAVAWRRWSFGAAQNFTVAGERGFRGIDPLQLLVALSPTPHKCALSQALRPDDPTWGRSPGHRSRRGSTRKFYVEHVPRGDASRLRVGMAQESGSRICRRRARQDRREISRPLRTTDRGLKKKSHDPRGTRYRALLPTARCPRAPRSLLHPAPKSRALSPTSDFTPPLAGTGSRHRNQHQP